MARMSVPCVRSIAGPLASFTATERTIGTMSTVRSPASPSGCGIIWPHLERGPSRKRQRPRRQATAPQLDRRARAAWFGKRRLVTMGGPLAAEYLPLQARIVTPDSRLRCSHCSKWAESVALLYGTLCCICFCLLISDEPDGGRELGRLR